MFKSVFKSGIRATYDVLNNPSFSTEPWLVYPGKHNTTGKLASVFIFDKSKFEANIHRLCSQMSNTKNPKVIISECYEFVRKEVAQMAKLKHPQLLTLYEPLEETKLKLLFVTEPVTDTLVTGVDKMDELSAQKGLLEICKALQFLHDYCSIIHLNLQPSSIFINKQGDWRLSGFKFLANLNEISASDRENFYSLNNMSIVTFDNINLSFTPPELVLDQPKLDYGNDMWSLGCLIFYVFNKGEYLINCFDSSSVNDYKLEFGKFQQKFYNHRVNDLGYVLKNIPQPLYGAFPGILARYPHDRLTLDQLIDSDYFNGSVVKAMFFVDEFSTKSLDDKLIFLRGLLEQRDGRPFLEQFPISFQTAKLLPLLIDIIKTELTVVTSKEERSENDRIDLLTIVLSIIFKIGSGLSNLSFNDRIFNVLFKVDTSVRRKNRIDYFTKMINFSVKVRLEIIKHLETIIAKVNDQDVCELIKKSATLFLTLPSNEEHFKQEQIILQDEFLSKVELFITKLDFPYIKNTFFPSITQIFQTTTILSTKLATIQVFETMTTKNVMDRGIVKEQLLPIFQNLKSRDKRIVSSVLNYFSLLANDETLSMESETIVEFVLPICLKLAFGCTDCTQGEFTTYISKINDIQKNLVHKKMETLAAVTSVSSFDSLITAETVKAGTPKIAPKTAVMTPKTAVMTPKTGVMTPKRTPVVPTSSTSRTSHHTADLASTTNTATPRIQPLKLTPNFAPLVPKQPVGYTNTILTPTAKKTL